MASKSTIYPYLLFISLSFTIKGIVQPKMKILSSFTHPNVISKPIQYDFLAALLPSLLIISLNQLFRLTASPNTFSIFS